MTSSAAPFLLAWPVAGLVIFAVARPGRALILTYLLGQMILPETSIQISGLPDLDKWAVCGIAAVLGTVLFRPHAVTRWRFHWTDVPLSIFIIGSALTSVVNQLGIYDGVSASLLQVFRYALPFWLARVHLQTREDLLDAATTFALCGAVYAIPALWEWRMSPHIHQTFYGFFQHAWRQHYRWGFWRPIVCFPHALPLSFFFAATSLASLWLLRARLLPNFWGLPAKLVAAASIVALVATMTFSGYLAFALGLGVWLLWQRLQLRSALLIPLVLATFWMTSRYLGWIDDEFVVDKVRWVSAERAESIEYRLVAEQAYLAKARQNWLFGLGAWGRANVEGLAADALWMILASTYGLLGLISFMTWWMGNIIDAWRHAPHWAPDVRQVAALWATLSGLLAVDFLVNGFPSPAVIIGAGGVCAISAATADARRIRASRVRKRRPAAPTKAAVHPPVGSPHARTP